MADWSTPKPVDDVTMAFPANIIGVYLPLEDEIPDEFWYGREGFDRSSVYADVASNWFFGGLSRDAKFYMREPLTSEEHGRLMLRHIGACLGSYEPKHEHKEAGVAYLLSLWCERITDYKVSKKEREERDRAKRPKRA